ncbi:hypothetical protein SLEP1_g55890 [Rubroshorea leprosula]|uniref:Reverse transcriptase domain-containing protein n=1 Tax=Rubroshorea leprosula TaxID=152421 RepID=A0AAV5MHY4_9ROSI|nr:hypothetical protein SLEP1_g55890 [Rubroshorea leprosula]
MKEREEEREREQAGDTENHCPKRRDRFGRRFGFVRFLEVKDKKEVERQLDQIWIGHTKLKANIPRFKEEDPNGKKESKPKIGMQNHPESRPINNQMQGESGRRWGSRMVVPHQSYADVLRGSRNIRPMAKHRGNSRTKHSEKPNRRKWQKKNNDKEWTGFEFNERFYMEGYFACKLKAMGGKLVLLESEDKDELKDLVENASDWFGQWFKEIKPWSPCMVENERFVWIRCTGVPLHSWGPTFFSTLSCIWGKFITLDESTSKKKRFDIARFLICTPVMDSISKKLKVKINVTVYNIRVAEEEFSNSLFSIKSNFILDFPSDFEIESKETWEIDSVEDEASKGVDMEVEKLFSDMEIRVPGEEEEDVALEDWMAIQNLKSQSQGFEIGERNKKDLLGKSQSIEQGDIQENINESTEKVEESLAVYHNSKIAAPLQNIGEQNMDAGHRLVGETFRPNNEETTESVNGPTQGKDMDKVPANMGDDIQNAKNAFPVRCNQFTSEKASDDMEGPNQKPTILKGLEVEGNISFWEGMASESERAVNWRKRQVRRKKSKNRTKKRARSCIAIYKATSAILQKRNRGEKCKGTQQLKENLPTFLPNPNKVVAGESVGDSGIINRNKEIRKGWKKHRTEEIWELAKQIGIVGQGEELDICQQIKRMEKRDRAAKLGTIAISKGNGKQTLRQKIVEHYTSYFKDEEWRRPTLDDIDFNRLSPDSAAMLVDNFTEEEVNKAVWDCGVSKAPGPDGFNFQFIREMWEVLKEDIVGFIQEFHENGKLVRGLNESFIVLIPKKENPLELEDFRPISLIGAMYKILTKILANRLSRVMQEIIGEQQTAFVKDDTILFGYATEENIWAVKCITRIFELVSGLKINYVKSQLMGVHVDEEWLSRAAAILNCKLGIMPFKYLGVPIGDNPRRLKIWQLLVENFKKKLSQWKGRFVSMGGRITLINVVLSSLPLFLMSMFLIPKGVVKKLDSIRRAFLWGGNDEKRVINWVGWENVCKSKEEGGLGVKNLRTFNLALMGKWRGRLAKGEGGLWHKVLKAKYGRGGVNWTRWMKENSELGSLWWRDVCRLNEIGGSNIGWLEKGFELDVGEGKEMLFWKENWVGIGELANLFPRLFLLSTGKENVISQMGKWKNGEWTWDLKWRHALREEEAIQLQNMISRLNTKSLTKGRRDVWHWKHDQNGIYSASSGYQTLSRSFSPIRGVFLLNPVQRLLFNMKASSEIKGQGRDGR